LKNIIPSIANHVRQPFICVAFCWILLRLFIRLY